MSDELFDRWVAALEARHLANLSFAEVSRALRALSSAYVERRGPRALGAALSGEGKRAAFALFYGPLHYLLIREIVLAIGEDASARLKPRAPDVRTIVDLGCGTGAAGAAWARACGTTPSVVGVDKHPWAVEHAQETYRAFRISARVRRDDVLTAITAKPPAGIVAAFAVNELANDSRAALLTRLVDRAHQGDRVLVVEPLARSIAPWWDEWRFRVELPPIVAKLDRAAGLDHRELTGRSIMTP